MSAPRPIYPMLDGFLIGEELSSHDGVRCYPALQRATQEKYILKVISVPASQVQLDALLITGAVAGKEAALSYFHKQAEEVNQQVSILHRLSHQEGFIPYLDSQIVSMEEGVGYEVYLLGTYKRSLAAILPKSQLTRLEAIHMGLDLCAALSACRRAGYLYADLKPGNIFYTQDLGYRIGDLGFAKMDSLTFTSLPSKYQSPYTAPEVLDDFAVLNPTLDVYALGMVLWQLFNGGNLDNRLGPDGALMSPLYADYELSDILLKACDADPANRWSDPTALAQALVEYLERNEIGNDPIIPPEPQEPEQAEEAFEPEPDEAQLQLELEALEDEDALIFTGEEDLADADTDMSQILAQADELIAHTLPEPPVAPEPVEVPIPEPIVIREEAAEEIPETTQEEAPVEETPHDQTEQTEASEALEEAPAEADEEKEATKQHVSVETEDRIPFRFPWRIFTSVMVLLLVAACILGGTYYYNHRYVQHIDQLILENQEDMVTVRVVSGIDDALLTVVCTDSYGNILTQPVTAGVAVFENLNPQTRYTIRIEIAGSHKLTGETSRSFSTAARTHILSFTAGIGQESGSVLLDLTATGPLVDRWRIHYSAEGEVEKTAEFTGNSFHITGLTVGKEYTFTLSAADGRKIAGQTQVRYLATDILLAQKLTITACGAGILTVQWQQPEGYQVESWVLHCYNANGFDRTVTTSELEYTFTGLTHDVPCTVDVTAVGMKNSVSIQVEADPVNVLDFQYATTEALELTVSWTCTGSAEGVTWQLYYRVNNGDELLVETTENNVCLPAIPGATYSFRLEAEGKDAIFGNTDSYTIPPAQAFQGFGVTPENTQWLLCLRPDKVVWQVGDVSDEAFVSTFAVGQQAGMVVRCDTVEASQETVCVMLVLLDENGAIAGFQRTDVVWNTIWQDGCWALDLPAMPEIAGSYTLQVFLDGMLANQQQIAVQ